MQQNIFGGLLLLVQNQLWMNRLLNNDFFKQISIAFPLSFDRSSLVITHFKEMEIDVDTYA